MKSGVTYTLKAAKLNVQFWQELKENGGIRAFAIIVRWFGFYNILCIPLKVGENSNFLQTVKECFILLETALTN